MFFQNFSLEKSRFICLIFTIFKAKSPNFKVFDPQHTTQLSSQSSFGQPALYLLYHVWQSSCLLWAQLWSIINSWLYRGRKNWESPFWYWSKRRGIHYICLYNSGRVGLLAWCVRIFSHWNMWCCKVITQLFNCLVFICQSILNQWLAQLYGPAYRIFINILRSTKARSSVLPVIVECWDACFLRAVSFLSSTLPEVTLGVVSWWQDGAEGFLPNQKYSQWHVARVEHEIIFCLLEWLVLIPSICWSTPSSLRR